MNTIKSEWAGIVMAPDHRTTVRYVYGDHIVATNIESFEKFIGVHGAENIMFDVVLRTKGMMNKVDDVWGVKDALQAAADDVAMWMDHRVSNFMPYALVLTDVEADDWIVITAKINDKVYRVCTISYQMEGADNRLHIDFYCKEK